MGEASPELCDYEGYDYEGGFWTGREYEDAVERVALRKLLPPRGERLVEIGAAFGRLADLYRGYQRVVFLDPAESQLREAQRRWSSDTRFAFVVGNVYRLPFATGAFDVALTVRVLHHLANLTSAFAEIHRILRPDGRYILEYANKRNLKEILRYLVGRSQREPFSSDPVEYAPLHFNFHPSYIDGRLKDSDFRVQTELAVSSLRLGLFKRFVPSSWLVRLDAFLQGPTAHVKLAPSIFLLARSSSDGESSGAPHRDSGPNAG